MGTLGGNIPVTYNPEINHRRSIRLKGYDYSQTGAYFVTVCVKNHVCLCNDPYTPENSNETRKEGEHTGSPRQRIIQWFKTITTNGYIRRVHEKLWPPFNGKLWQRNYYEHIIRGDRELQAIREYIRYNPQEWDEDEENPKMKGTI
jgi:hypothetical protein